MMLEQLIVFFRWCTILNAGLLILSFVLCAAARDFIYRMHSKWFPMPQETFTVVIYSMIGVYKLFFIMFNLVPYLVLSLMS